jgi:hypothetical protein
VRRVLPILGLWCALSLVLAALTTRVRDWFAMPNELLYERRAISVAQTLSPLPRVRGELVSTFDQLYPVLVAPAFRWGTAPDDLWAAHALNAFIMASASIPAFLLARRVTANRWAPYVVAVLTVVMPWIIFASLLMTEVAAYPAYVWAVLAMQASTAAPSRRNDLLALVAIAFAFAGRTQLAVLLLLLPVVILAVEIARADGVRAGIRAAIDAHRLLAWVFGVLAAVGLGLALAGKLPDTLGVYGATIGGTGASVGETIVPSGIAGSLVEHIATFALGLGILPFVVGAAWLLANLVRPAADRELHTFACVGAITVAAIVVEVTIFDIRFGDRFVHDRYLFYVVPQLVLAFVCALADRKALRWSLVLPTVLVVLGFAFGEIARFTWEQFPTVNSDAPISALYRPLVDWAGSLDSARVALAVATVLLTALYAAGAALLPRRRFAELGIAFLLVVVPGLTAYMFHRLLDAPGWSGRPLTESPQPPYDWVDRTVGAGARVAMAPYPVSTAYFVNQRVWRDYEFWNKSVDRDVQQPDESFLFSGDTFEKLYPRFDPTTGRSDVSPAPYVLQANQETRFRVAGTVRAVQPDVMLIDAEEPWRVDWQSSGLYADGWTQPGTPARIRVYPSVGQRGPVTRALSLGFRAPEGVPERRVEIASNLERWEGTATADTQRHAILFCVPADGFAEVTVRADGSSEIPPDLRTLEGQDQPRQGGIFLSEIALADEIGEACEPGSA